MMCVYGCVTVTTKTCMCMRFQVARKNDGRTWPKVNTSYVLFSGLRMARRGGGGLICHASSVCPPKNVLHGGNTVHKGAKENKTNYNMTFP